MTVEPGLAGIIVGLFVLLGQLLNYLNARALKGQNQTIAADQARAAKTMEAYHAEVNGKMTELNAKTGEAAGLAGEQRERDRRVGERREGERQAAVKVAETAALTAQIASEIAVQLQPILLDLKSTIADALKK